MICVAQNYLCAYLLFQVAVKHALHRAHSAYGHKDGRADVPVRRFYGAGAGRTLVVGMQDCKRHKVKIDDKGNTFFSILVGSYCGAVGLFIS
jgi:hypothetical protein